MTTIKIPIGVQFTSEQLQRLRQTSGLIDIKTTDHQLIITLSEDKPESISQILTEISDMGNNLEISKSVFPVEKMSCSGCASSAERLLSNQPGVVSATVEFSTKSANIYYTSNETSPEKLKESLQALGYELVID